MKLPSYFARKYLLYWLLGAGAALFLVAGGVWWCKLSVAPDKVFWGMVEQSLSTNGVTMTSVTEEGQATLRQSIQYSLGVENRAMSHTTLKQSGAEVHTQVIGTPEADYTRYAHIHTPQTNSQGQPLDVSQVLNVWAKADTSESGGSGLLSQAVLGLSMPLGSIPVPIGNLNPEQRAELIRQIHNEGVYEPSFKNVKKEVKNGRMQYTYEVKIQSIPYVHLMKEFAKRAGLHDLDQIDPNNFQGAPISVKMTVDARSRQLVAVEVPESNAKQTFSAYGVPVAAKVPKNTITAQELQQRLGELQQQ